MIDEVEVMREVGNRLRKERKRLGLSQEDVAKTTGTTTRTLIGWEAGNVKIPSHKLSLLSVVKFDTSYILTGREQGSINKEGITPSRLQKMAELMDALSDEQQQEIWAAIAEKKRMNELERMVLDLADKAEKKTG